MNDGHDFAGQNLEVAGGEISLAKLNIVHAAAASLSNILEQAAAGGTVTGKLRTIGDVVEKQSQSPVSVVSLQSLTILTTEDRRLLGIGLGNFRHRLAGPLGLLGAKVVFHQTVAKKFKTLFG